VALLPLRTLALPETSERVHTAWLGELDERLGDPSCDRYRLCRDVLFDLYHPGRGTYDDLMADAALPLAQ
jgi:hypothetical protein